MPNDQPPGQAAGAAQRGTSGAEPRTSPPPALRKGLINEWMLEPGVDFLNHGSFGAVPRVVFEEQTEWRRRIEAAPVEVIARRRLELIDAAKQPVGLWLGMRPDDFGLVTNATEGVNAVLHSLRFGTGDELLTTTHVYNAVRQAMKFTCDRSGATYREVDVPLPVRSADDIADAVIGTLSDRTRLLVIDHVTSPTALVFPVERITAACAGRGVDVLIDGAHAPGMIPLNVGRTGAAYYAGNLHKWAFAPRGAAFLWARPDRQARIHPAIISHHYGEGFCREFSWQGTRDLSAWLAVPRALQFASDLGLDAVREHNHAMAVWAHQLLCDRLRIDEALSPLDGSLIGSMAAVPLGERFSALDDRQVESIQQRLYTEHRMEVPLMRLGGRLLLRVSCQVYNEPGQYERVAQVVGNLQSSF
jgi:isopenicillin-N epimerase